MLHPPMNPKTIQNEVSFCPRNDYVLMANGMEIEVESPMRQAHFVCELPKSSQLTFAEHASYQQTR